MRTVSNSRLVPPGPRCAPAHISEAELRSGCARGWGPDLIPDPELISVMMDRGTAGSHEGPAWTHELRRPGVDRHLGGWLCPSQAKRHGDSGGPLPCQGIEPLLPSRWVPFIPRAFELGASGNPLARKRWGVLTEGPRGCCCFPFSVLCFLGAQL